MTNYVVGFGAYAAFALSLAWCVTLMPWFVVQETVLFGFPSVRSWTIEASLWVITVIPNCETSLSNDYTIFGKRVFRWFNNLRGYNFFCGENTAPCDPADCRPGEGGLSVKSLWGPHSVQEMSQVICAVEKQARTVFMPFNLGCDKITIMYVATALTSLCWITCAVSLLCASINTYAFYKFDGSSRRRRWMIFFYVIAPCAAILGVLGLCLTFNVENFFPALGRPAKNSIGPLSMGSVIVVVLTLFTLTTAIVVVAFADDADEKTIIVNYDATAMYGSFGGEAKPELGSGYSGSTQPPSSGAYDQSWGSWMWGSQQPVQQYPPQQAEHQYL